MNKFAVVMACNQAYAPYALCLAEQIAQRHPDRKFDICIFSDEQIIIPETLRYIGLRTFRLETSNFLQRAPISSRHSIATYFRLLIPAEVKGIYERILYLDSDIICLQDGIERLFSVDLGGASLGAVRDNQQWRTPLRQVKEFGDLGLRSAPYFNAGVLLIDVNSYNSELVLDRAIDLILYRSKSLLRHDQSILNLLFYQKWAELSPIWNWQYTWASRFYMTLAEPCLVHFIGPRKPWKDTGATLPASFRQIYSHFQAKHFPEQPELCRIDATHMGWPDNIVKSFLKHALIATKMRTFLAKFSDPYQSIASKVDR